MISVPFTFCLIISELQTLKKLLLELLFHVFAYFSLTAKRGTILLYMCFNVVV